MKGWVEGHPYIFLWTRVSGVHVRALIDTGSMKSSISAPIFKKISPRPVLEHNAPQ